MNEQCPFNNIDSLLFQFALKTRELSQKKNEINQQIKVCRADMAERRSYIETTHRHIKELEEEIKVKQRSVLHNKANAKSMKATNNLLLHYEQALKEELESRKASYNNDMEVYEERIASYWKTFQSHKEYYHQNPLAQKLLMLQAEKDETESRMKACDDKILIKLKELDRLAGPAVNSFSTEKLPDSVYGQQDSDSSIDISSLHLNQTKISRYGRKISAEANAEDINEENKVQETTACSPFPEEASNGLLLCQPLDEEEEENLISHVMHTEEQDQETGPEDQVLEQQSTVSDIEEVEEREALEEEQTPSKEDTEGLTTFPQSSSQETNPESSPATVKAVPSTPTFLFNFSPSSSPHQGTSDTKSPAFLFSLNSDPSTTGFSGFGFDVGSSQNEDSAFTFGSFFDEKKTTETKSSCPEFLFGQPEQSEDFQFAFTSKSPQTTNTENTGDDFPFSFNF